MLLLGIGHKARHGKDTAALSIIEHAEDMGYTDVYHFKFAEALYRECREQHGMVGKDAALLQKVGHGRRQKNSTYWIDKVFSRITMEMDTVVISDVRYRNEADYIKGAGGVVLDVNRVNFDGTPFVAEDRPADHPSETELDGYNFDYYITCKSGEEALVGEHAITLYEYLREVMN